MSDLINWIGPTVIITGIGYVWFWVTQKYLPGRDKRIEEALIHNRKQADSDQAFDNSSENSALQQTLKVQEQLITHLITSNNGHMSDLTKAVLEGMIKLTEKVMAGTKEQAIRQEEMIAAFNQLIVFLSREWADLPRLTGIQDWQNTSEIEAASIKSAAVKTTDDLVNAATKTEEAG